MGTIDLNVLFDKGMELHSITNTAYPLTTTSVKQYAVKKESERLELLTKEYHNTGSMSLYVHSPFCKKRCKFCEYVVVTGNEKDLKDEYTDAVLKEIDLYSQIIDRNTHITGFDIGGGTPTELGLKLIEKIVDKLTGCFRLSNKQIWSIETTPYNAVNRFEELRGIYELGFHRISMGVQTVNEQLLKKMEREGVRYTTKKRWMP